MKKKLISLLQRKRHIVALSTILMTFIVMSCLFIDSVDITQMIDGKAVNYAKAGTTATFKMHGHIKVQGDPRNDKRLVFGFLAPKSWNLAQNARVSYTEDTFDPNIGVMVGCSHAGIRCRYQYSGRYGMGSLLDKTL